MESHRQSVLPIVLELTIEIIKKKGYTKFSEVNMNKWMGAVDQILPRIREYVMKLDLVQQVTFLAALNCNVKREDIAKLINEETPLENERTPDKVKDALHDARVNIKKWLEYDLKSEGKIYG